MSFNRENRISIEKNIFSQSLKPKTIWHIVIKLVTEDPENVRINFNYQFKELIFLDLREFFSPFHATIF